MLRTFVEQKHYKFAEEAKDWKDAIRMSCESLEADGTVEANYKEDIIACVEKHGPYIVVMPVQPSQRTRNQFMSSRSRSALMRMTRRRMHSCFLRWLPAIRISIYDCFKKIRSKCQKYLIVCRHDIILTVISGAYHHSDRHAAHFTATEAASASSHCSGFLGQST